MAENEWKKSEMADAWDYKEAGKNAEVVGLLTGVEEDVGENHSIMYSLEQADGEEIAVWGSTVLDTRLKNVKVGEEVRIVYLGLEKSKKPGGREYHSFDVYHREVAMDKVEA